MLYHFTSVDDVVSPYLFNIPHTGTLLPLTDSERALWTKDDQSTQRLVEGIADLFADQTVSEAISIHNASAILSKISRCYVDVERFLGDTEEMNAVGMGAVYTHGIYGEPLYLDELPQETIEKRLENIYYPYHAQLNALCERTLEQFGHCMIFDIHSYSPRPLPFELHQNEPRNEIILGVNHNHTPLQQQHLIALYAGFSEAGYDVGINTAYKGSIVPSDHMENPRVSSVMIEIRKDMYLKNNEVIDSKAERINNTLNTVLHDLHQSVLEYQTPKVIIQ